MIQDYDKGGLKMADMYMVNHSSKLMWIKEYLNPSINAHWKHNLETFCGIKNLNLFLQSNFCMDEIPSSIPPYYLESIKIWRSLKYDVPFEEQSCLGQFLWYNRFIKLNKKSVYCSNLMKAGLWYLKDLFNEDCSTVPFHVWRARGASMADFLVWSALVKIVQQNWKEFIRENIHTISRYECGIDLNDTVKHVLCISQQEIKSKIKAMKFKQCEVIKSQNKYNVMFTEMNDHLWKVAYMIPHHVMHDNKIKEMQFKILHRIIGTNKFLYKINRVPSPTCTFCNLYMENIEHLFYECLVIKNFWFRVAAMWNICTGKNLIVNSNIMLLGFTQSPIDYIEENILILIAKRFIYLCKLNESQPELMPFKNFLLDNVHTMKATKCEFLIYYENIYRYISDFENV